MIQGFFQTPDGRYFSTSLVQVAIPRPGGGWTLHLKGDRFPVEVDTNEFLGSPERLVRAGKGDVAMAPDGTRRRVLWWRILDGDPVAQPVLGLVISEPTIDVRGVGR